MRDLAHRLRRVAPTRLPVHLTGPTGVGKTLAALVLHEESGRAGAFEVLDCGSLDGPMLRVELLGARRGAYTDCREDRTGALELADGGTLFLDEVAEVPVTEQPRLLRVLAEQRFAKVGGGRQFSVDVRVVSATNHDLDLRIALGRFREELKFRLVGDTLRIPGLDERREDVAVLATDWLRRHHPDRQLGPTGVECLEARRWPGNVRELEWVLARAVAYTDALSLERRHLVGHDGDSAARRQLLLSGRQTLGEIAASLGQSEHDARGVVREAMEAEASKWGSARAAARAWGCPWSTWMTRKRWPLPREPIHDLPGRDSGRPGSDHLGPEIDG